MKHTIFDYELKTLKEALDCLYHPQDNCEMDERKAYQTIHYIVEEVKNRNW